jgi:hypothetical protein
MNRKLMILLLASFHFAEVQQPAKVPSIGWVVASSEGSRWNDVTQLVLRDLGYVDSHVDGNLPPATTYFCSVAAFDPSSNASGQSASVNVIIPGSATPSPLPPPPQTTSTGALRVHPANPRFFIDNSGKAIYLGGHQIFKDFQDYGYGDGVITNWPAYLEYAKGRNLNYLRNWTLWSTGNTSNPTIPMPYLRTGPGLATDGQLKFDLTKFDQWYFDRMRSRIIDARNNGMYVSIMLFDAYGFSSNGSSGNWFRNVFNSANNINGINVDTDGNKWGAEFFFSPSTQVSQLQKDYVQKVIDTVNDLDNVIYEIANEVAATSWQYDMINFIKSYEATKPKQHLVYMSGGGVNSLGKWSPMSKSEFTNSPAHMFSPLVNWADYQNNPPIDTSGKPIMLDMDHINPGGPGNNSTALPWKSFTRGIHFSLYDGPWEDSSIESAQWETVRKNIGATVQYANKMKDLSKMTPSTTLCSTTFCLANPGSEYLAFQPGSGSFTVSMTAGTYNYEWFNPETVSVASTGSVTVSSDNQTFTPPFSGMAVLYLYASTTPPICATYDE